MSKKNIALDYCVVATIVKGLKSQLKNVSNWLDELEHIIEKANHEAYGQHEHKRRHDRATSDKNGGAW